MTSRRSRKWVAAETTPPWPGVWLVDASVAVKWYLVEREEDRDRALRLRDACLAGHITLRAPDLIILELGNALKSSKRSTREETDRNLEDLLATGIVFEPLSPQLIRVATAVAWRSNLSFYDALYVAMAEREALPLVSADARLLRSLPGHSFLRPLSSITL